MDQVYESLIYVVSDFFDVVGQRSTQISYAMKISAVFVITYVFAILYIRYLQMSRNKQAHKNLFDR